MNQSEIHKHIQTHLSDFEPIGNPIPLDGGMLNYVWRIQGKTKSIILKYAPPYVASNQEIPLSQCRIEFEAKAMRIFHPSSSLSISNEEARLPSLLDFDSKKKVLIMEDIGFLPNLSSFLSASTASKIDSVANKLGHFLAKLHTQTAASDKLAEVFHNEAVQRSRLNIQYNLSAYCEQAGIPQAKVISNEVLHLGECLQAKGQCVIMGDFWPPSILVGDSFLRIIDWEFSHYGWPVQDIAHLIAHLWMLQHTIEDQKIINRINQFQQQFIASYRLHLSPAVAIACIPYALEKHFGAEILMRTIGPFKNHYLFQQLSPSSPIFKTAIETASQHILFPKTTNTFWLLNQ